MRRPHVGSTLFLLAALPGLGVVACGADPDRHVGSGLNVAMNDVAQGYVRLVLGVGQHDPNYVDAYYGPEEWRVEVEDQSPLLDALSRSASSLIAQVESFDLTAAEEIERLRHRYLLTQLRAVRARVAMLQGDTFTFDEEASALYDASPPTYPDAHFAAIVAELDDLVPPGPGSLAERLQRFKQDFVIPTEKLDTVFQAAIAEARRRTAARMELPEGESFVIEYVTDKSWSGYNWYQGKSQSLIQLNTDLPIAIDRAIDLAAHEGYPGHHVYNALLERHLVDERGWVEFSVYPLFSPQSLIAEGSANFGIEMAFPGEERVAFERDVLYPLAGLDPSKAAAYAEVQQRVGMLNYARNEAARRYLNGEITWEQAASWLQTFALMSPERARQSVDFIDTYRSYVINYNLGMDLVRTYIERQGGTADQPDVRWLAFGDLLSSPRLPSGLE
jgi:hypothetical protein